MERGVRTPDASGTGAAPRTVGGAARTAAVWGAAFVGLGVALGAFGAHTLSGLVAEARLETFETAVRYQVYQGLGLLALAAIAPTGRLAARSGPLLIAGTLVFSGALYALVAGAPSWFGAVAPVGGVLLIAGWAVAVFQLARKGA
ncbi:MAG: DUF423 domain-containing protein [Trueperaceae bacterium]|nr:DUF423 domain-containing protein [Trueperaceae bacterium]